MTTGGISFLFYFVVAGLIFGTSFFYLLWSLVARKFLSVDYYKLALYMASGFLVAVATEPVHDMVYKYFSGEYLWIYQVWPIFGGASTGLAFLSWPFYGYYFYFFNQMLLSKNINLPTWVKGSIPAIDGVIFDIVANGFFLLTFGVIFFYYPRPELWHLSSWWVIPFYWVSGMLYAYVLKYFLRKPKNWSIPLACYALGSAILLIGDIIYRHLV